MKLDGGIRGMAWDHPRALDPLAAISRRWAATTGIAVEWEARPLKAFEDQPLEELASTYDLVLMDYPFTGTAATSGLISPVDDWADPDYLEDQRRNTVGPSFLSYAWNGRQWALAIDAACQVSAHRPDLVAALPGSLPDTWEAVAALAEALKQRESVVGIPLNPNHAYCAFLSVGLGLAGKEFWPFGECTHAEAGRKSLKFLRKLARDVHPGSREDDPIAMSDRMSTTAEIAYVPLMFGYSSYAREGFRQHRLRFGDAPRGASGMRGSVLGGVGVALTARSAKREAVANLARTIGAAETQGGIYVQAGGQPGHATAWESDTANALTAGFFRATRATMEQAFLRPRVPGHRLFQQLAGELIHRCIWDGALEPAACMVEYQRLFDTHLGEWAELERASRPDLADEPGKAKEN